MLQRDDGALVNFRGVVATHLADGDNEVFSQDRLVVDVADFSAMNATGGATMEVRSPGEDSVASVQDIALEVKGHKAEWVE